MNNAKPKAGQLRVMQVIPGPQAGLSMIFSKRQADTLERLGVNIHRFFLESRTSPLTLAGEWLRFRRELAKFNPHIIHAQYGTMTAFFCAFGCRKPLVIIYRGSDMTPVSSEDGYLRLKLSRLLSQLAALRASGIICVSEEIKNRLWFGHSKVVVLPTGADTALFKPCLKNEARASLKLPEDIALILFHNSGKRTMKRLDLAQQAVELVQKTGRKARLLLLQNIDRAIVPDYFNSADCLLLTSDHEGSPTVVQEAMACNVPVVSVAVGDAPQMLEGIHPGGIVPREPQAIAGAICQVLDNGARSNGRDKADIYSEETIAKKIIALYRQITARKGK